MVVLRHLARRCPSNLNSSGLGASQGYTAYVAQVGRCCKGFNGRSSTIAKDGHIWRVGNCGGAIRDGQRKGYVSVCIDCKNSKGGRQGGVAGKIDGKVRIMNSSVGNLIGVIVRCGP